MLGSMENKELGKNSQFPQVFKHCSYFALYLERDAPCHTGRPVGISLKIWLWIRMLSNFTISIFYFFMVHLANKWAMCLDTKKIDSIIYSKKKGQDLHQSSATVYIHPSTWPFCHSPGFMCGASHCFPGEKHERKM